MTTPLTKLPTGRLADDPSKPKLDFTPHLMAIEGVDWTSVPTFADYIDNVSGWRMLGNGPDPSVSPTFTGAGDCEAARVLNHRFQITGQYMTMDDLWTIYREQNPGFNPLGSSTTDGPGSSHDGGMSTDKLCAYHHKNPLPDGSIIVAYGTVDPSNQEAVERAIAVFGAVWVDILVLDGNQQEFANGADWTNDGSAVDGGHAVLGGAVTQVKKKKFVTWASVAEFAESFWTGEVQGQNLVQSVYVIVWPEHANGDLFLKLNGAAIAADYLALTGSPLIWPAPAPNPTPGPAPAPIPAYQPDAADLAVAPQVREFVGRRHVGDNETTAKNLDTWLAAKGLTA